MNYLLSGRQDEVQKKSISCLMICATKLLKNKTANGFKKPNLNHIVHTMCDRLRFDISIHVWWRLTGSNRRPPACKAGALPAELNPPGIADQHLQQRLMVGLVGLEPTTPALSTRCSNQLSYRPVFLFFLFNSR